MTDREILLIVDDVKMNRAILTGIFGNQYRSAEAENGVQAIQFMQQHRDDIAVVLLDLSMPLMDGYQVMDEMNRQGLISEIPVIIITADNSSDSEIKAFDAGASDVITKPFEAHIVRRRVHNVIELNRRRLLQDELIEEQAQKLRKSNAGIIATLASIVETRSLETGQHIKRMGMYVRILLENAAASFPEYMLDARSIDIIMNASSLHDIGKVAIPDAILNKPGKLSPQEYEIMKSHTLRGCEILDSLTDITDREYLQYAYNICRYHHERWDGRGYPDGLRGDAIPICAQAAGIADCYDALTNDRVYKNAIPPEEAISMILNGECGIFSPKLLECLKAVRQQFMELARDFADEEKSLPAVSLLETASPRIGGFRDVRRSDSLKYFALLNYIKATVMEVDLATGIYQLVYQCSSDFDLLRSGANFAECMTRFADGAVHPDDRERMLQILGYYTEDFFAEGLLQMQRRYRIYNRASGEYLTWLATMLRINPDAPQQQHVLLLWRRADELPQTAERKSVVEELMLQNTIIDIQPCIRDNWLTMPYVSSGLLSILGYTADEIRSQFSNRFICLIHPDDQDDVLRLSASQQRLGPYQEMEYRLISKCGQVIWVLEKSQLMTDDAGRECFYCALIDVTRSKRTEEELRSLIERYQIVMERTSDVIFEWRADTDQLSFSSSWNSRFGWEEKEDGVMGRRTYVKYLHRDDVKIYDQMLSRLHDGEDYDECEARILNGGGTYRWCLIRITVLRGQDGTTKRAVGVIADIDAQKKVIQQLRSMAERDSLTLLYNKKVAKKRIDEHISAMQPGDSAAMFVIDVDDFKRINDRYGHMPGDAVLQRIASALEGVFRSSDIVARIGGDEFLVFMTSVRDKRIIEERAVRINSILQGVIIQTIPDHTISCSVGLVLCPSGGTSFDELFIHGDLALYDAKHKGKNQYSFYDESLENADFEVDGESLIANNDDES